MNIDETPVTNSPVRQAAAALSDAELSEALALRARVLAARERLRPAFRVLAQAAADHDEDDPSPVVSTGLRVRVVVEGDQ